MRSLTLLNFSLVRLFYDKNPEGLGKKVAQASCSKGWIEGLYFFTDIERSKDTDRIDPEGGSSDIYRNLKERQITSFLYGYHVEVAKLDTRLQNSA